MAYSAYGPHMYLHSFIQGQLLFQNSILAMNLKYYLNFHVCPSFDPSSCILEVMGIAPQVGSVMSFTYHISKVLPKVL